MAEARQEPSFDEFYVACFDRLVGQLTLVTGSLHEAEDVVQEAFLRASTHWARLRQYDVPEQWVRRVALRLAINRFRRGRRRTAALLRSTPWPWTRPCGPCPSAAGRWSSSTTCSGCRWRRSAASSPSPPARSSRSSTALATRSPASSPSRTWR